VAEYLRPVNDPNRRGIIWISRAHFSFGLGFHAWWLREVRRHCGYRYGFEYRIFLLWWEVNGWLRWGKVDGKA
jgi:hypothetical protein